VFIRLSILAIDVVRTVISIPGGLPSYFRDDEADDTNKKDLRGAESEGEDCFRQS